MGKMRNQVNPELISYIEEIYYPVYATFDGGHDISHIEAVIGRALDIAEQIGNVDIDLVYAAAALHDIGMSIEREGHSTHSKEIVEQDENLRRFFDEEEIRVIGEAVEDHSTSRGCEPRDIYGKIASDADKDLDVSTSLMRAYDFSLRNYPDFTPEEHADRVFEHLNYKFGENGIVRFWTDASEQREFAAHMKEIALDRNAFDDALGKALAERGLEGGRS